MFIEQSYQYGIKIATNKFTVRIWKLHSHHLKYTGDDSFAIQQGNQCNILAHTVRRLATVTTHAN